jgi:hypothetical protein
VLVSSLFELDDGQALRLALQVHRIAAYNFLLKSRHNGTQFPGKTARGKTT